MRRKYSIVLTVYNSELYLKQCLDSILAQTYDNWELIIVNDGSTDNSGIMAEAFAATVNSDSATLSSVVYLKHNNKGTVFSRERGICNASGDYLLFIDADDYYDPDLIEKVNEVIENTSADIIQFGYKFVDEDGNDTTDCGVTRKGGTKNDDFTVDYDNKSFSYKAISICYSLWSRAIKTSLFDKAEGFYEEYYDVIMTNDLLAFARPLSLAKSYCFTEFYLYNYRILDTSTCHNVSIQKICSYFKSISWAEKCLSSVNGDTREHFDFFSMRLVNIVFDEYREYIYTEKRDAIKKVYSASSSVNGIYNYLTVPCKNEKNWYKKLFLKSFIHKWITLPKILCFYTKIRNKINSWKIVKQI